MPCRARWLEVPGSGGGRHHAQHTHPGARCGAGAAAAARRRELDISQRSLAADGIINAGYAVWRECIAEIIAIELDDNCKIVPLKKKADVLRQLKSEIEPVDGKLAVSEILTAIMTSSEIEASQTWEEAETAIQSLNLFDTPPEMDLFRLVYAQLRTTFLEVDVGFIHELGYLYLNVLSMAVIRNLRQH